MSPLPVLLVITQTGGRRFGESAQNKSDQLFYSLFIWRSGLFQPKDILTGSAMQRRSHYKTEDQIGVAGPKCPFCLPQHHIAPQKIPALMRLGKNSARAAENLARTLAQVI